MCQYFDVAVECFRKDDTSVFISQSIGLLSGITREKYALTVTYISNFLKVLTE